MRTLFTVLGWCGAERLGRRTRDATVVRFSEKTVCGACRTAARRTRRFACDFYSIFDKTKTRLSRNECKTVCVLSGRRLSVVCRRRVLFNVLFIYVSVLSSIGVREKRAEKKRKPNTSGINTFYDRTAECGRVLDCAHDDECSFKLTSAEARRSVDDVSHGACAARRGERGKIESRIIIPPPPPVRSSVFTCVSVIIISRSNTNTIFGVGADGDRVLENGRGRGGIFVFEILPGTV